MRTVIRRAAAGMPRGPAGWRAVNPVVPLGWLPAVRPGQPWRRRIGLHAQCRQDISHGVTSHARRYVGLGPDHPHGYRYVM